MEITSKQNTYIKEYRKLTEQRKYRRQTGYFVCEGAKLAVEAVKSGCALVKTHIILPPPPRNIPNV